MRLDWVAVGLGCAVLAGWAGSQEPEVQMEGSPLLSLGTPALRASMEQRFPALEFWPDLRLRLEHPGEVSLALEDLEPRVRSIEIRLPMSFFWFGYEWPSEGEEQRATFSIQRGF